MFNLHFHRHTTLLFVIAKCFLSLLLFLLLIVTADRQYFLFHPLNLGQLHRIHRMTLVLLLLALMAQNYRSKLFNLSGISYIHVIVRSCSLSLFLSYFYYSRIVEFRQNFL